MTRTWIIENPARPLFDLGRIRRFIDQVEETLRGGRVLIAPAHPGVGVCIHVGLRPGTPGPGSVRADRIHVVSDAHTGAVVPVPAGEEGAVETAFPFRTRPVHNRSAVVGIVPDERHAMSVRNEKVTIAKYLRLLASRGSW